MHDVMENLKKIPIPIWIGLALVMIVIFVMNSNQQQQPQTVTTAGPVITPTTQGTQGVQPMAGTDQQLGNLSQVVQGGFSQIAQQDASILSSLSGGMTGIGTPMTQVGSSMQSVQNQSAAVQTQQGTTGQNTGTAPSEVQQHPLVGQYTASLPGGGTITVNASSAQAAQENVSQETGTNVPLSSITKV